MSDNLNIKLREADKFAKVKEQFNKELNDKNQQIS